MDYVFIHFLYLPEFPLHSLFLEITFGKEQYTFQFTNSLNIYCSAVTTNGTVTFQRSGWNFIHICQNHYPKVAM